MKNATNQTSDKVVLTGLALSTYQSMLKDMDTKSMSNEQIVMLNTEAQNQVRKNGRQAKDYTNLIKNIKLSIDNGKAYMYTVNPLIAKRGKAGLFAIEEKQVQSKRTNLMLKLKEKGLSVFISPNVIRNSSDMIALFPNQKLAPIQLQIESYETIAVEAVEAVEVV